MNSSAPLGIKIISLAVVVWAVLHTSWLSVLDAAWVPWMALILLMLLEAYGTDSKPASWSQWSAGLLRLLSPGMLPYYAVLCVCLALGPEQLRHEVRVMPHLGGPPSAAPASIAPKQPSGNSPQRLLPASQLAHPPGVPANTTVRPSANLPGAPRQPGTGTAANPGAPPRPVGSPSAGSGGGPIRFSPQPGKPAPALSSPGSSASPADAPVPAK